MNPAIEPVVATLELAASEHPELYPFQVEVLLHSAMRPAMLELAELFEVDPTQVGSTVFEACSDLRRLEKTRAWRHPTEVVDSPNVPALYHVCLARTARVQIQSRQHRLKAIARKLAAAYRHRATRAWIDAFLGLSA